MTLPINHNRYHINQSLYTYNRGGICPLITEFTVVGMMEHDSSILYSNDKQSWIREDYLFMNKEEAYQHLIQQAQDEMKAEEPEEADVVVEETVIESESCCS